MENLVYGLFKYIAAAFEMGSSSSNIKPNELVILREKLLPPMKWDMVRVVQRHPGTDGRFRVVIVKTATSALDRPITQVCRLSVYSDCLNDSDM